MFPNSEHDPLSLENCNVSSATEFLMIFNYNQKLNWDLFIIIIKMLKHANHSHV